MALQPGLFYAYAKHVRLWEDTILNSYSHTTRRSKAMQHGGISSPFLHERLQMSGGERFRALLLPVILASQTCSVFRCNGTPMTQESMEI